LGWRNEWKDFFNTSCTGQGTWCKSY